MFSYKLSTNDNKNEIAYVVWIWLMMCAWSINRVIPHINDLIKQTRVVINSLTKAFNTNISITLNVKCNISMTLFQIDKIWPAVSTLYFLYCIILTILYLLGPFQNKTKQSSFRKGDTLNLASTLNRK